jgi:hypothetical protein
MICQDRSRVMSSQRFTVVRLPRVAQPSMSRADSLRKLAAIAAVALPIAACGASVGVSPSGTASPARLAQPGRIVLVLTQTLGYHHASIPWAVAALRRVAARDGRYRVVLF